MNKRDAERGARGGAWGDVRIERPPHDPTAHVISTYYDHEQRQRHDAARQRARREYTSPAARFLIFAVLAATVAAIFL